MVSPPDINRVQVKWWPGFSRPPLDDLPPTVLGREADIAGLIDAVRTSPVRHRVLAGLPGCGKTTVALATARELNEDRGGRVLWLHGQNQTSYVNGLVMVAADLGADEADLHRILEDGQAAAAWTLIADLGRRKAEAEDPVLLLVIDNIEDAALYREILAATRTLGSAGDAPWFTLLTVSSEVADQEDLPRPSVIDPPALPHAASIFLQNASPLAAHARKGLRTALAGSSDEEHATTIAAAVGRLPLALRLAGLHHLGNPRRSGLREYATELARLSSSADEQRPAADRTAARLLLPVLMLGIHAAAPHDVAALGLLRVITVYRSSQPLPAAVLTSARAARDLIITSPEGQDSEEIFEDALNVLVRLALIGEAWHPDDNVGTVAVHPVIVEAVRRWPRAGSSSGTIRAAAAIMDIATGTLDAGPGTPAGTTEWQLMIPHVVATLESASTLVGLETATRRCAVSSAVRSVNHLVEVGMHRQAADVARLAVRVACGLSRRDAAYLDLQTVCARIWHAKGKARQAQKITAKVYDTRYDNLGPHARETIESQRDLAVIRHSLGLFEFSESDLKQVLRYARRLPKQPRTVHFLVSVMHDLASVLHAAGRPQQALTLLTRVQAYRNEVLDDHHPDAIATRHSLAYVNQAIGGPGSLSEAHRSFSEVWRARVHTLGETHPNTLITRHNLAWIRQAQNDFAGAQTDFESVLAVQLRRLGPMHPHVIATKANLAWTLLQRGELPRARTLFEEVLRVRVRELGQRHPETQTTRGNLAWLTLMEGRAAEAEEILRPLLLERERGLGEQHPRTLTTRHNLALSLRRQDTPDKLTEAESMFRDVLKLQPEAVGEEHASTLATKNNLALTIRARGGDLKEAARLLREVLSVPSPNALTVMYNLSFILRADGEISEAEAIDRDIARAHRDAAVAGGRS